MNKKHHKWQQVSYEYYWWEFWKILTRKGWKIYKDDSGNLLEFRGRGNSGTWFVWLGGERAVATTTIYDGAFEFADREIEYHIQNFSDVVVFNGGDRKFGEVLSSSITINEKYTSVGDSHE